METLSARYRVVPPVDAAASRLRGDSGAGSGSTGLAATAVPKRFQRRPVSQSWNPALAQLDAQYPVPEATVVGGCRRHGARVRYRGRVEGRERPGATLSGDGRETFGDDGPDLAGTYAICGD
jgi:hypothetical protein